MHKKLFIPGPTEVSEQALRAMATPMVGHRTKEYSELQGRVVPKLQKMLYTENPVYIGTCSSTGWMEGAVRNCVRNKCLNLVLGAFSKRWHEITLSNGFAADMLEVEWGKAIKPEMVDAKLATGEYDAVTLVHNETSTGVMNPLAEIAAVVKKYDDVVLLVDGVSSMAGVKIPVDEYGIDVCLAGVQKAFALPPGLAVAAVSERAHQRSAEAKCKGYYFDFLEYRKYAKKDQTPATPAISHMYALDSKLDEFFAEGLDARWARHLAMAEYTRAWAKENFDTFAEEGYQSVTLTTVRNTRNIDVAALNAFLAEKGVVIANGYGDLKNKTFRIAHMGDTTLDEMKQLLGWIDEFVAKN